MKLSGLRNIIEKLFWSVHFFLHKTFNFPTLFCTKYPHTSLHSKFFFLGNNTNYVSHYGFALRDCWDIFFPVKLCDTGLLGSRRLSTVMHMETV